MGPDIRTLGRQEPWLGREMASEFEVEFVRYSTGAFSEDPHPSRILQDRSEAGQRLGELYDDMLAKDSDLAAFVAKRIDAVLALPRYIKPADSSPEAVEASDLCRAALEKIPNFDANLRHQLGAFFRGVAHDELIWERMDRGPLKGMLLPVDAIDRPMWRFLYRDNELYVRRATGEPVKAPPAKFLAWTRGTKDKKWGKGAGDGLYWYWFIKKHGWKFYSVFLEKWAQPTVLGKYAYDNRSNEDAAKVNQERQAALLEAAQAIQSEQAIVIPEDVSIGLMEATRSGAVSYEQFIALCTRGEAVLVLGEVDTSGMAKGPGSFAKSQISNEDRIEKIRLDAHNLGAHIRDNLLRLIVHVNLGPDVPVPYLEIDVMEAEDRELRQEGIARVLAAGKPVPEHYFYSTHQVPMPRPGEKVITAPPKAMTPRPSDEPPPDLGSEPDVVDDEEHQEAA